MAKITIPDENRVLIDDEEISKFLSPLGLWHERWPLAERVDPDASSEEILKAYEPEIETLKRKGGFVTADVINVTPETPGLDAMLTKFAKEHTHSEDEVRFILKGKGVFHLNLDDAPVFEIEVTAGDMINVPTGTRHWFNLCREKTIRAIRLFEDPSGWTPQYIEEGVDHKYPPLCWGPSYLPPGEEAIDLAVKP
ncbi:Acireductone dioxygenase [Planctomycetes bacterium Pan216]|uniref:Acireductone dioxygenase n=1 Tax=Kolteria novifilia TaxID=2527975 RepID=A0A518B6Q1_9BACT|nr:Acireductone dioxygenase [Planctomycetes bacterium Pan216]